MRRANPALLQTANLRFLQVDDDNVIGFIKEAVDGNNAVAVAIALSNTPHEFWLHFGDALIGPENEKRPVRAIENLVTGERHLLEWGGSAPAHRSRAEPGFAVPLSRIEAQ